MRSPCIEAAVAELRSAGVSYRIDRGGKHWQLRWSVNNGPRVYTVPATPSDWRLPKNVRADVRRLLRADGLITSEPADPPAPRSLSLEQRVARLERLVENFLKLPTQ